MLVDHVSCRVVTHQHDISIQIREHQRRSLRAWHHVGRVPDTRPRAHLGSGSMARWARVQFQRESAQLKIQTWGTELRQMMHTDCCRHVVFWPWQKCIIIEDANLPCVWLETTSSAGFHFKLLCCCQLKFKENQLVQCVSGWRQTKLLGTWQGHLLWEQCWHVYDSNLWMITWPWQWVVWHVLLRNGSHGFVGKWWESVFQYLQTWNKVDPRSTFMSNHHEMVWSGGGFKDLLATTLGLWLWWWLACAWTALLGLLGS